MLYSTPMIVFQKILGVLGPVVLSFCNRSLSEGPFLDKLKIATGTEIFKSAEKRQMHNYGPVSVMPVCSKSFEKIASTNLRNIGFSSGL